MLAGQAIGFGAAIVVLAAAGLGAPPPAGALGWAAAAGLAGTVGLGAFYLALARGTMGLVAPLAALIGAGLPAAVAIVAGEEPGAGRLSGLLLGLAGVVLISLPSPRLSSAEERALRIDLAELPLVVLAGLGFAGFYLLLDRALGEGADIWWSLVSVRTVGLALIVAVVVGLAAAAGQGGRRRRVAALLGGPRIASARRPLVALLPLLLVVGLGDLGGNGFFIVARQHDLLSVSVVLSSLYPVVTTVLGASLLGERLNAIQLAGVGLALMAVALIGLG